MSTTHILIAGFGGQGVLFAGKFLAYKGLIEGCNVRGGTANCSVIISSEDVGSPIVDAPDVLIAMNLPSLDKYEGAVVPGGKIFYDSTLISRKVEREDVKIYAIPATRLASESSYRGLGNMILMGKVIKECDAFKAPDTREALSKVVSARHQDLLESNLSALDIGYNL